MIVRCQELSAGCDGPCKATKREWSDYHWVVSRSDFETILKELGWSKSGRQHVCPKCTLVRKAKEGKA